MTAPKAARAMGTLTIGDAQIPVYRLADGDRAVSVDALHALLEVDVIEVAR